MIMTAPRTIARTTARMTAVLLAQRIQEAVGILQVVTRSPIHPRTPEMAVQTSRIIQKTHLRTMETKMIPAGIILVKIQKVIPGAMTLAVMAMGKQTRIW